MDKQPIALRPLIGLNATQRRALRAKVAEVSRWLDQYGITDEAFTMALITEREAKHVGG